MPSVAWRFAIALAVTFPLGCATARSAGVREPSTFEQNPREFVARVAELRRLPLRRPVPITRYGANAFADMVERDGGVSFGLGETAIWNTPLLVALGISRFPLSSYALSGLVEGEYDTRRSQISVLRTASDGAIAHELVHALQDQNFALSARNGGMDAQLARMALIEGDASWTELLLSARTSRKAVSFASAPDRPSMMFPDADRYELSESAKLTTLLLFPYTAGARFCGLLRQRGDVALLNAAYRAPPKTTEQVLHVEKYLAREPPIPVRIPNVAKDQQVVAAGHLGELLLRTALLSCNGASTAERAATGWGGDAFVLTSRPGFLTLTLATVWDSTADAAEFEDAMRRTATCWDQREPIDGDYDGPTLVRRGGRTVIVVRGNGPYARATTLAAVDQ